MKVVRLDRVCRGAARTHATIETLSGLSGQQTAHSPPTLNTKDEFMLFPRCMTFRLLCGILDITMQISLKHKLIKKTHVEQPTYPSR